MQSILENINATAIKLLDSHSVAELSTIIVEEGKKLIEAEYGAICLLEKDKLGCVYTSSPLVDKMSLKKKGGIEKTFRTGTTAIIQGEALHKLQPELFGLGIKSVTFIPLTYHRETTGVLILHSSKEEHFTQNTLHKLQLYGSMASLALTKARLHEKMQHALEVRDRFIALASHELRTPLTSLNGYIQLLHAKLKNKGSVESGWVEELYNESNRLTTLVKELLDINRIKQGRFAVVLSEVDLAEIVKNATENAQTKNPERKIIFKRTNNSNSQCIVIGDSQKLLAMTDALLSNALKFSAPKDEITISLTNDSRSVQLELKDQGKGIKQKDISRIFEGFYKTQEGEDKEGMGVGLMLAKHIIHLHRGKLVIDSKENKGTTVGVILPAAKI